MISYFRFGRGLAEKLKRFRFIIISMNWNWATWQNNLPTSQPEPYRHTEWACVCMQNYDARICYVSEWITIILIGASDLCERQT